MYVVVASAAVSGTRADVPASPTVRCRPGRAAADQRRHSSFIKLTRVDFDVFGPIVAVRSTLQMYSHTC